MHFVSDERNELFLRLIENRTDYFTIILEDLYQTHNQSAILRSADCFGIEQVHIIENRNSFNPSSTVSRGAKHWLNIIRHNSGKSNTADAIRYLKERGYRIIATTPHADDMEVSKFRIEDGPAAFIFGTELTGISETAIRSADGFVKIPMYGFTESFNVSVCAAILMYDITTRLHNSDIAWHLTEERRYEVLLEWYKHAVKSSDEILERFNNAQ